MSVQETLDKMMVNAREALKVLSTYDQEKIDALCKAAILA